MNLRGKRSERQEIQSALVRVFASETTQKIYYKKFQKAGLTLYLRGEKIVGVQGLNRRYRLKTLGFDPTRISLEQVQQQQRINDLKKPKKNIDKELER